MDKKEFTEFCMKQMEEVHQVDAEWLRKAFGVYLANGSGRNGVRAIASIRHGIDIPLMYSTVARITALLDRKLLTHKKMKGWAHILPVGALIHEFVFEIAGRFPVGTDEETNCSCFEDRDRFVNDLIEAANVAGHKPTDMSDIQIPGLEKRGICWKFKESLKSLIRRLLTRGGTKKRGV